MKKGGRRLLAVSLFLYVVMVLFLVYSINVSFGAVIVGTVPLLVYVLAFFVIHDRAQGWIFLVLPVFLCGVFYIAWKGSTLSVLRDMDGGVVAALNMLMAYMLNVILFFTPKEEGGLGNKKDLLGVDPKDTVISRLKKKVSEYQKYAQAVNEKHAEEVNKLRGKIALFHHAHEKKDVEVNLQTIEDKCKAINAVIGRAYSDKNGGSKEIRDLLKVDRELYKSFLKIT